MGLWGRGKDKEQSWSEFGCFIVHVSLFICSPGRL